MFITFVLIYRYLIDFNLGDFQSRDQCFYLCSSLCLLLYFLLKAYLAILNLESYNIKNSLEIKGMLLLFPALGSCMSDAYLHHSFFL